MAIKSVSIRIAEEMPEKLGFVSDYEGRSVNSHILVRLSIASLSNCDGNINALRFLIHIGVGDSQALDATGQVGGSETANSAGFAIQNGDNAAVK